MHTPHKRPGQGQLRLVLLGSAAALAACQPSTPPYSTQPEQLTRAGYTHQDDCVQDWGSSYQCEEVGGSGGARYWGPYYSSSGRIYGYDGVTRTLMRPPTRANVTQSFTGSEHQVYSSGQGKYAAAKANISRGGFGGGGREGVSFGG
jgi:uncharacterized protein YgiB involved in biofilm formation